MKSEEERLFQCWVCKKKLTTLPKEEIEKLREEKIFFHCSKECQNSCELYNYKLEEIILEEEKENLEIISENSKEEKEEKKTSKEEKKEKEVKQKKCGKCKEFGHNKRTCEK